MGSFNITEDCPPERKTALQMMEQMRYGGKSFIIKPKSTGNAITYLISYDVDDKCYYKSSSLGTSLPERPFQMMAFIIDLILQQAEISDA